MRNHRDAFRPGCPVSAPRRSGARHPHPPKSIGARTQLAPEHREQALLALAQDYLRAGVLDRAEGLFQQVSEVPRLRASALDALRGVYERQHDWQQALGHLSATGAHQAAPPRTVAAHYLCELAALAIERGDIAMRARCCARRASEATPFPRAALLRAQIAEREAQPDLAVRLLRQAIIESPTLLQEELPHSAQAGRSRAARCDTCRAGGSRPVRAISSELKRLVFAAIAAGLGRAPPLRASIEKVFSQDAALQAVWQDGAGADQSASRWKLARCWRRPRKYRCNECGFSGRSFYWHCPACHSWDSFEAYAIVKLR